MNKGIKFTKPTGETVKFKTLEDALEYFNVSKPTFYKHLEGAKKNPYAWIGLTPEQRREAYCMHIPEVQVPDKDGFISYKNYEEFSPPISMFQD